MNIQVVQIAPLHVAMIRHRGPYEGLSAVFDQLYAWIESNGVPSQRTIGIYLDNPDYVPAAQLRSAACAEIPYGIPIPELGALPISIEDIQGGNYATTTFVGPYEALAPVWSEMTNTIERSMRKTIREDPAFEVYVNDASTTPPSQLVTELYMPIF